METTMYDINKLPKEEGLIIWGISMSKIGNAQSPAKCFEYLQELDKKIAKTEGIGLVFVYADYLYFHSSEPAKNLRNRYKEQMIAHKNGFLNLLTKDPAWIKKAFSFSTFGQVMLDNSDIFNKALGKVNEMYEQDEVFQERVRLDSRQAADELSPEDKMFILEEITLFYLAAKGQLQFNNRFVTGTEKWVLQMYPGRPLESEMYLFQKNPLKLHNEKNRFENHFYDLEKQKLYNYVT